MSALGDYIHYNPTNYLRYGTHRRDEQAKIDKQGHRDITLTNINLVPKIFEDSHQKILDEMQKNAFVLTNDTRKEMQNFAKLLTLDDQYADDFQALVDFLSQEFGIDISNAIDRATFKGHAINRGSLTMSNISYAVEIERDDNNKIVNRIVTAERIYKGTIQKRLSEILDALWEGRITRSTKIDAAIKAVWKAYQNLDWIERTDGKPAPGYEYYINAQQDHSKIDDFNKALSALRRLTNIPASRIGGGVGETVGAYIIERAVNGADRVALDKINDVLTKDLVGNNSNKVQLSVASDIQNYLFEELQAQSQNSYEKNFTGTPGQFTIQVRLNNTSKNKVDVRVTVHDTQQQALASIKNYNLKSGYDVNIVSSTSFLTILNYIEDTDYSNHLLNVLALRDSPQISYSWVAKAYQSLAERALADALRGFQGRSAQANLFMVFDNSSSGDVLIFTIEEIFLSLLNRNNSWNILDTKNGTDLLHGGGFTPLNAQLNFNQAFVPSSKKGQVFSMDAAWKRIARFLAQIHKQKISVTLNPNTLKDFIKTGPQI